MTAPAAAAESSSTNNQPLEKLFIVDDDLTALPMVMQDGDESVLVTHHFKRAQDESLIELAGAVINEVATKQKGVDTFKFEEDTAFAGHYFEIIDHVDVQDWPIKEGQPVETLAAEDVARQAFEDRAQAVRNLYEIHVNVLKSAESSPQKRYSFLFESDANMEIEVLLGDQDNPSYRIVMQIQRPEPGERTTYRQNSSTIEIDRRDKRPKRSVITDIKPGLKLFKKRFATINKGIGFRNPEDPENPIPYDQNNPEHKQKFLTTFNVKWMAEIIEQAVDSFYQHQRDSRVPSRS